MDCSDATESRHEESASMPIRMTALSAVSAAPAAASLSIPNRVTAASSGASPTPDASSAPQLRCGSRWRSAVTA